MATLGKLDRTRSTMTTKKAREAAVPFATALTLERVKILQLQVEDLKLKIDDLEHQLSITETSREKILARLNRVREALYI